MTLRAIDTAGFKGLRQPADFGPAPQLQWIKIADLVVDDAYQRPVTSHTSRANIRAIAEAFDWRRLAPVVVAPIEGGRYAIVDGQHRTTAAAIVGIAQVPCLVIMADRGEQARAFQAINGQVTAVSRHQMFKARLRGGEPEAMRIDAVARSAGVRILFSNLAGNKRKPHETVALSAISRMVAKFGDAVVSRSLVTIFKSAGGAEGYLSAAIIIAVTTVLADHPEWRDHRDLDRVMEEFDLCDADDGARAASARTKGLTRQSSLQAAIITHLDRALCSPERARLPALRAAGGG